jgi:hypothetical protein
MCHKKKVVEQINTQSIRIIQSNTSVYCENTLIYKATCFSSTEPSSGLYRRTDPYQIFFDQLVAETST